MIHPPGKVVSSFTFPNFPQQPVPGRALPPSQPYMGTAVTSRGRTGTKVKSSKMARPGIVEGRWFGFDSHAEFRFVTGQIYGIPGVKLEDFQNMVNSNHPTRIALGLKIGYFVTPHPFVRLGGFSGVGDLIFSHAGY